MLINRSYSNTLPTKLTGKRFVDYTTANQLLCTISNKDAKIKALTENNTANYKFVEELEIELSRLREEHMNCPAQRELVNVQTSPTIRDWIHDAENEISAIHLRTDQTVNTLLATTNNLRLQKYCELCTAAFEIKKKVIQRTE
ncbi:unnamed protein product [Heterobilharzia americana]|nr:unnamed protein product [Heterobilharzia americana]